MVFKVHVNTKPNSFWSNKKILDIQSITKFSIWYKIATNLNLISINNVMSSLPDEIFSLTVERLVTVTQLIAKGDIAGNHTI